eukprot:10230897-Alexandrium_andersonii.AAC.1
MQVRVPHVRADMQARTRGGVAAQSTQMHSDTGTWECSRPHLHLHRDRIRKPTHRWRAHRISFVGVQ